MYCMYWRFLYIAKIRFFAKHNVDNNFNIIYVSILFFRKLTMWINNENDRRIIDFQGITELLSVDNSFECVDNLVKYAIVKFS